MVARVARIVEVSTHSRAKAAAYCIRSSNLDVLGFNTQPREGGCSGHFIGYAKSLLFQHTAARRRLHGHNFTQTRVTSFQHTAARRRLHLGIS